METVNNVAAGTMETVNNVAAAASRAIWGEPKTEQTKSTTSGEEPVSGELGNTKVGEPYDKGNEEPNTLTKTTSSEPKSLTKTSSRELTSSDSTADLPSTSNLPSTAAHSSPLANHETSSAAYVIGTPLSGTTHEKKPETLNTQHEKQPETETGVTLPRDEKTDAATKAAIDQLEKQAKALKVGDTNHGASDTKGDGLVSAKKVEQGEGVNTGVKATSTGGVQASKEPASIVEPAKKTLSPAVPAAASSSTTTTTPATSSPVAPRKSESSGSSEEDVVNGGRKKKLSLKEKIKAKLHKH